MIDVAHVFNLFAQYADTARDLLFRIRPRRFAQVIRTPESSHLKPFQFLVISLFNSAVFAFTAAALILAGPERETLFHLGILGCLAIIVFIWLENLAVIAAAKVAAFMLGVSAPVSDLFEGYCYASISFPVFIVTTEMLILLPEQQFTPWVLLAYLGQLLFVGVAGVTMISFVPMHPRYAWRTIVATFLVIFGGSYGLVLLLSHADTHSYAVHPLRPFARLQSSLLTHHTFELASCDQVTITGTVVTNGTGVMAWFEWGETPDLSNVTTPRQFSATTDYAQDLGGLQQDTTYYYRAVNADANGSFKGQIRSFRTAHCPQ